MQEVDDAILARAAELPFKVYDGFFLTATAVTPVVIDVPLPYAVYVSSTGDEVGQRAAGRGTQTSTYFSFRVVGEDRRQVKAAAKKLRDMVMGTRLTVNGRRAWRPTIEVSSRIWRDDEAVRPDGRPLFYGVDEYAVKASTV